MKMEVDRHTHSIEIGKIHTDSFGYPDYYRMFVRETREDYYTRRYDVIPIDMNEKQLNEFIEMLQKVKEE